LVYNIPPEESSILTAGFFILTGIRDLIIVSVDHWLWDLQSLGAGHKTSGIYLS
jgi:hypothetical protein